MSNIWTLYAPSYEYSHEKTGAIKYLAKEGDLVSRGQKVALIEVIDEMDKDSDLLYPYDVISPANGKLTCYFTNGFLVRENSLVASIEGDDDAVSEEVLFDDWLSFSEKMRPEIDAPIFFPEKLLPHPKKLLLKMFIDTYKSMSQNNVPSVYIDSIGINVCNLFKFVPIQDKHPTQLQRQLTIVSTIKDKSEHSLLEDLSKVNNLDPKLAELDKQLINSLTNNLLNFCEVTGYDKRKIYQLNFLCLQLKDSLGEIESKFNAPKALVSPENKKKPQPQQVKDVHENIYANKSLGQKILIYIGITLAFGFAMSLIKVVIRIISQS